MQQNIKVLIVDDEPIAQEILETYLAKIPGVELAGKCKNALEAFAVLNKQEVDVLLLDINMPEISGIDFIRTLKKPPHVILITAYAEFAVESYELNVVDYLLKPVSFDRFLKAMHKVINSIQQPASVETNVIVSGEKDQFIFVKSGSKLVKISLADIWLVEGLKDYVRLWTEQGNVTVHSTMKNIEEQLFAHKNFLRVHKSHIINFQYVSEVNGNVIKIKDQEVVIGNTYKDEVQKILDNYKLL